MRKSVMILALTTMLGGCNLAPKYVQPTLPVAETFPGGASEQAPVESSAARLGWRDFFQDARLQILIAASLERNRDLAQSLARVAQARAQYRIQETQRLPTLEANGQGTRSRQPLTALGTGASADAGAIEFSQYGANVGVSAFELDLWGRVRNLAEAERQRYLASEEGARTFRLSLIAQVAAAYYDIQAGEERIALARQSLEGREEGLRIARKRLDAGVTSTVDYDQSMLLLTQAQTELAELQRTTEQARNLLDVLTGGPISGPLPVARPLVRAEQVLAVEPGLPSALLIDRPDILEAEHNLRAANADIGAARAAFFPTISLTGNYGFASSALDSLFDKGNQAWSFGGAFNLPVFDWGRRSAHVKVSKARADELTAAYQRAVQGAFQEVADALVARRRLGEQIVAQERTVTAQLRLARTARHRYDNGIAIYLEVLDAERNLFAAQQQLLQLRATDLQNSVSLYVALGNGLEEKSPGSTASP
ncbi:efflux transporter outer membrane subunit [Sphingobium sp. BHU LFT2]|uniref:efflux transporter outer membrane subunit n=1 Tax=Sphingobium sp. BHU LFT2 TaxID=2807634 RepID=UPI001BE645B6|nr:efflux transporter outer membrane subunit [Sphingobium sp. BHU LFT2]MBT2246746.1 efflux transporter outer membrane subunit [Sphingobium sp. BHU LFT2]